MLWGWEYNRANPWTEWAPLDFGSHARLTSFPLVWKTCRYESRDGQFNPDVRQVNNVGDFQDFSEAVFYNTIAWALDTQDKAAYEANAGMYFLNYF